MRDGLGIALACNDLDWTRVWQVARRNCTVGRMVGVAAIGAVTRGFMGPLGGFWPKLGRKRVTGWKQRSCVPPGRVKTNKQTNIPLEAFLGQIENRFFEIVADKCNGAKTNLKPTMQLYSNLYQRLFYITEESKRWTRITRSTENGDLITTTIKNIPNPGFRNQSAELWNTMAPVM
jgi:hypothetical protein